MGRCASRTLTGPAQGRLAAELRFGQLTVAACWSTRSARRPRWRFTSRIATRPARPQLRWPTTPVPSPRCYAAPTWPLTCRNTSSTGPPVNPASAPVDAVCLDLAVAGAGGDDHAAGRAPPAVTLPPHRARGAGSSSDPTAAASGAAMSPKRTLTRGSRPDGGTTALEHRRNAHWRFERTCEPYGHSRRR